MRLYFNYTSGEDGYVISNGSDYGSSPCASECDSRNEKCYCNFFGGERRRAKVSTDNGTLYVCTGQAVKSSRIFKEKRRVVSDALDVVDEARNEIRRDITRKTRRHIHNLEALNGESIQEIYDVIGEEIFQIRDRDELTSRLSSRVRKEHEDVSKLILDLLKNEQLEKKEFAVYRKLYEEDHISRNPIPIHKVVLRVLNVFWDSFSEKGINFDIGTCHDKALIDFDCVASCFIYILDNSRKYICPKTTLKIGFSSGESFVDVKFTMMSQPIGEDEVEYIFDEGFSGKLPSKLGLQGDGIGLHLADRLINLTDGKILVDNNIKPEENLSYLGLDYEKNVFTVRLPLA